MIVLREKYKGMSFESLSQEYRELLKDQNPDIFNKYFIEQ